MNLILFLIYATSALLVGFIVVPLWIITSDLRRIADVAEKMADKTADTEARNEP